MPLVLPVDGGQYRSFESPIFDVDLVYIEALTPLNSVPAKFVSLLGLPDLKRHNERTRLGVKASDIVIIDRFT